MVIELSENKNLNFLERLLVSNGGIMIRDEMAQRNLTERIVFHVKSNGATGLGATTNMIELKAHESFDKSTLAVSLVTNYKHSRCVEWRLQLLRQSMKLIVSVVEIVVVCVGVFFPWLHIRKFVMR